MVEIRMCLNVPSFGQFRYVQQLKAPERYVITGKKKRRGNTINLIRESNEARYAVIQSCVCSLRRIDLQAIVITDLLTDLFSATGRAHFGAAAPSKPGSCSSKQSNHHLRLLWELFSS
ncbi:hypothetical protein KPH14_002038 [Odynerus spinipes]|uniref:Uncharacterized protein n=1 Tax=Odynerus spinipes TaxID=1348599 RepID=A0AAD9S0A9_9HYME|nr:hypothetical protein KPH14_002038 [Odynerus spinipes]